MANFDQYTRYPPGVPNAISPRQGVLESPNWNYVEPLLTPEDFVERFLFGLKLESNFINPFTGQKWKMTPDIVKDWISRAASDAEYELNLQIFPLQMVEKMSFTKYDWQQNGYMCITQAFPITAIHSLKMVFANNQTIWNIPLQYVETANLYSGQLNIFPNNAGFPQTNAQGDTYINGLPLFWDYWNSERWIAALVEVEYTAGFPNGIPPEINEFIGTLAAIRAISMLLAMFFNTASASLNIDGMGQSLGPISPVFLRGRIDDLKEERDRLKKRIKGRYRHLCVSAL